MRLAAIGKAIYRRYGHCFAEFLNEGSLVHLTPLRSYPPVSVCGTGTTGNVDRFFLSPLQPVLVHPCGIFSFRQALRPGRSVCNQNTHRHSRCVGDRLSYGGAGILTCCPSTTPFGLALGPTYPGSICVAQETSGFRWAGFSPAVVLLIPTFSLPATPPLLTERLRRCRNAPLPLSARRRKILSFGTTLKSLYIVGA